jgi:hypothetical protein
VGQRWRFFRQIAARISAKAASRIR